MNKFHKMSWKIFAVTAGVIGLLVACKAAKAEDDFAVYEGMARAWVHKQTGWDMELAGKMHFVFKTKQELAQIYYQDRDTTSRDVEALYSDGVVFIRDDFKLPEDSDILVHEYVHHAVLQLGMKGDFKCLAEEERLAYEIHSQWVDKTGWGSKPSPLWMMLLACRADERFR